MYNYLFFFFISFLSYIIEKKIIKCKNETVVERSILLIHHILTNYLFFGSILFGFYRIHLIILLFVSVLYLINKSCIMSVSYRKLCKLNKSYMLISLPDAILYYLGYKVSIIPSIIISSMVIIYDIYMIKICKK